MDSRARRSSLLRRVDGVIAEIESSVSVDHDPIAAGAHFERLSKMLEVRRTIARAYGQRPYLSIVAILGCAAIVSALQMWRVRETEVDIHLVATTTSFTTSEPGELALPETIGRVTVGGLSSIEMPDAEGHARPFRESAMALTPAPGGQIEFHPLTIGTGAEVVLAFTPSQELSIHAFGGTSHVEADLQGPVRTSVGDKLSETTTYVTAQGLRAHSSQELWVNVQAGRWDSCIVCAPVAISELRVVDDDDAVEPERGQSQSAVVLGTIRFYDVPSAYELHRGERLHLELDHGELRELTADPSKRTLEFSVHASVKSIIGGSATNPIDLKPTRLEWIRARHSIELAWGSFLALLAMARPLTSWLERRPS